MPSIVQRNPFVQPRIPAANKHADIEIWNRAVKESFAPFVRRRRILAESRQELRAELINLLPILDHPGLVKALLESVRMCRKAIYLNSAASHAHQVVHFSDTSRADDNWLGLCASMKPLDANADLADRVTQAMTGIDALAEGCLKPRIKCLFGFAHFLAHAYYPSRVRDFGECIADWPTGIAGTLRGLMKDPAFGISISQWRNIAAHRSYLRTGPDIFQGAYGKKVRKTFTFNFAALQEVLAWSKQLLAVCRMANVIIYTEFMPELLLLGLPDISLRFDAFVVSLSHSLRMVGFTYFAEKQANGELAVLYQDDLKREPKHAIVHASQVLDQLAVVSNSDVALRSVIKKVGIGLVTAEEIMYASASVDVDVALRWLSREISQKQYIAQIDFWIAQGAVP
ncbi:MAG: hypothetical protein WBM24_19425 [Candidatus Sulfotelmatobacter sp.]